jgi:fido (protein-threonine AMPylation protein)
MTLTPGYGETPLDPEEAGALTAQARARFRTREMNIGIPPEQVAVALRTALENARYRWKHTEDWKPRELGIAVHAETVRIHPFIDGNGRATRLLADLVFLAAQGDESLQSYDWAVDKGRYIELLREYDRTRDPRPLATFVPVVPIA